jgi:voltage-dependent potassium channel beta subunit
LRDTIDRQSHHEEAQMKFRRLGRSGLQVSELSFGSWVTYGNQLNKNAAKELMAAAFDAGINFFDNAEIYAGGQSEELMGASIRELNWPRMSYVISTKFYWGLSKGPNQVNTLNRKYLMHAIDASLKRLQLEYVDLVYCHRPDPHTPIEETVWAMNDMITRGKALYWGTSEWNADDIRAAYEIAERHHLHKPLMEQPQYNLFHRRRVETEYKRLYDEIGLGLTTWSPLASGLLTGKYKNGVPKGSRAELENYAFLREGLLDPAKNAAVVKLQTVADELGCTLAQLAIAWALKNPHVSTVITGASRPEQLRDNMRAGAVAEKITDELRQKIEDLAGFFE